MTKQQKGPVLIVVDLNSSTNKADRVGFKIEDGKKSRIFKSNGEAVDA